jgi:hypothetical protein
MFRRFLALLPAAVLSLVALVAAAPASAGVQVRVNLTSQTMQVTTPDGQVRNWAISSGRTGFRTIRGSYRPYMLKTHHVSRKYGGAMPHAIFFKGGFAIHGTSQVSRLGAPASHGCIRLAPGNARELFNLVKRHGQGSTRIAINGVAPDTGRTMIARAKAKQQPQIARTRTQPSAMPLIAPAFAPVPFDLPGNRAFQRLR